MRLIVYILCFIPLFTFAQDVRDPYAVTKPPQNDPPGTVKQGVIKVRKPAIRPYFKCEYYLTLASVSEQEVTIASPTPEFPGELVRVKMPIFDSMVYGKANTRLFPEKRFHFSRKLVDDIQFAYGFGDTSSIDTMVVEMWIAKNGKIRWRNIDTTFGSTMPRELELELYQSVNGMTEWGEGGGYLTPKKFMRKQKRIAESYYCVMYIIASSKPITPQQKSTGVRYAPIDFPLNAPANEEPEERKGNKKDDGSRILNDSIIRDDKPKK